MSMRRMILKAGAFPILGEPLSKAFAQPDDPDYEDIDSPFLSTYQLYGTKPALGEEEDMARSILEAPKGDMTPMEIARYFENLTMKNRSNHYYNAQWPDRWNPVIVGFYQATTLSESYVFAKGDTIPWCAAFVNWCLIRAGYEHTKSAMSGSFRLGKGLGKPTQNAVPGDVIVFKKTNADEAKVGFGHVGFYVDTVPGGFRVLGGNQKAGKRYSSINTSFFPKKDKTLVFDSIRALSSIRKM